MKRFVATGLTLCGLIMYGSAVQAEDSGYHVAKKIQLGGDDGWDCLTVDGAAQRLYVSRGTHVMVVDLAKDKLAGDIPDTPGVHGIALVPELNRGFISCGKIDAAVAFDLKTLKVTGQVKTGANPDIIFYDPAGKRIWTCNGRSHDATVIDPAAMTVTATVPLAGKPEFAVADGQGKVFVNLEDTGEIVALDSLKPAVLARGSLKPGEEPSGLALDAAHHRLFSACSNNLMTVTDSQTLRVLGTIPVGAGADGAAFDPGTNLVFCPNGKDGTMTIARESAPGQYKVVETVPTERGARTLALDESTHTLYLPTAKFGPEPKPVPGKRQRPPILHDTFVILEVSR